MVNQLDKNWNKMTWPQRYQLSSYDINFILVNKKRPNRDSRHWTKEDVSRFMKWIKKHSITNIQDIVLYRGTWDSRVPFWNNDNSNVNQNLISTSRSERIAKEFSQEGKGYIHILYVSSGCILFDMSDYYDNTLGVQREKEIIILPGHQFTLVKRYKHRYHWIVTRT